MNMPTTAASTELDGRYSPKDGAFRRRALPAWLLSVLFHSGLLLTLGLVLQHRDPTTGMVTDRPVGVAIVRPSDGERDYFSGESATQSDANASAEAGGGAAGDSISDALPSAEELNIDLSGVLPSDAGGAGEATGGLLNPGELRGAGTRDTSPIGGTVKTEVFGVSGEGTRFVYVFDRSGSMAGFGGKPMRAAKSELLSSLNDLQRVHQFQIIFYNERPRVFNPDSGTPELVWGDKAGKQLAKRFVAGVSADGGTKHIEAISLALRMGPDVVFFLTDADEPRIRPSELARIRRLNKRTAIHTIEFGFGRQADSNNFLVQLAEQNGGQHVYVDVSKLK